MIILKKSVPARIVFDRKDPSPCPDQIVFPDFGVHADLPMGEEYVVEITPEQAGRVWLCLWYEHDARQDDCRIGEDYDRNCKGKP